MNQFTAIGRTTKDIEIKKTNNGKEYAIFQLAVARPHSNKKETDFIPCQVWNKQASVLQQYCQKGSQIAIKGILQSFKDKDNKIHWMVRVYSYEFLQTKNNLNNDTYNDIQSITPNITDQTQLIPRNIRLEEVETKELFENQDDTILWD
ncbi:single-stranded DNA-binding protein [Spiroplasma kunkelii CR2-3x]|uniref:Single-stranded DNA-binding protein n=1 Tax=Spiroplasma kunkelii CR2-3x TaxID=273035 RepID=A0A0K2JFD7_SPIKU|nr:single-stranded DNA-binding protein [Spiroplasma kunkelii]ALA96961.1 single-stranded DNA-binding protein [Spiroplasma kunkelii CR2-3x]